MLLIETRMDRWSPALTCPHQTIFKCTVPFPTFDLVISCCGVVLVPASAPHLLHLACLPHTFTRRLDAVSSGGIPGAYQPAPAALQTPRVSQNSLSPLMTCPSLLQSFAHVWQYNCEHLFWCLFPPLASIKLGLRPIPRPWSPSTFTGDTAGTWCELGRRGLTNGLISDWLFIRSFSW